MTCSLDFTGAIKIPASTPGLSSSAGKEVPLQFAVNPRQFDRVVSTDCPYTVASAAAFTRLPLSDEMTTVEFVALAVLLSGTAEILIGDKPTILGAGGTFPTGFAGGETYTFELQTYNPRQASSIQISRWQRRSLWVPRPRKRWPTRSTLL